MPDTMLVNLIEYDSSKYLSILHSMIHSKDNILAQNNRQGSYFFNNEIQVPYDVVNKEVVPLLRPFFLREPLDKKYHMNPQFFCHVVYNCVDLWDIILKINNCLSCEDFIMEEVNYISEEGIQELFIFLQKLAKKNYSFKNQSATDLTIINLKY